MFRPFDRLKPGPRHSIPITLSLSGQAVDSGSGNSSGDGFPYDLNRQGNIGKDRFTDRIARKLGQSKDIGLPPIDGSGDKDIIHVHLPPEKRPTFHRGDNGHKGYGSDDGEGKPGDVIADGPNGSGRGRRGGHGGEGDGGYDIDISAEDYLKIVFANWELPNLVDKPSGTEVDEEVTWDQRTKAGIFANLDKRAMIRENLKRKAMEQHKLPPEERTPVKFGDVRNGDLRFRNYSIKEKPITNAVVFAMRDVSGSIGEEEAYAASVMLSWTVRFLKTQYDKVQIVFGYHHSKAKINISEQEFFNPTESGGTDLKPAIKLMNETIDAEFPPSDWNVYPFYVGDGEIFEQPGDTELHSHLTGLLDRSRRMFYAETNMIRMDPRYAQYYNSDRKTPLMQIIEDMNDERIIHAKVNDREDMKKALDHFFSKKEGAEGAVSRA